ncbi:MAG: cytochrome C [Campylobacterota bacterium]|nr:cytochrome C [Campylobacterota bacterium]
MSKLLLFAMVAMLLGITTMSAAVYKGQRVFVRKCVVCHHEGQTFLTQKTISQWEALMKDGGKPLAKLHTKDKNATESWEYFGSEKYSKKAKHLKQFLMEYAKDSGKVPACN